MKLFSGNAISFERLALTYEQAIQKQLPANIVKPTKNKKGPVVDYINKYKTKCWELDAIDPNELVTIVEGAILEKLDLGLFSEMKAKEDRGRAELLLVGQHWGDITESLTR